MSPKKSLATSSFVYVRSGCPFVAYYFFFYKKNRPSKPSSASAPDRSAGRNTQSRSTK